MRVKDESRLHTMNDLQVHANAILIMVTEYKKEYKDTSDIPRVKMDELDKIWSTINFNIGELVRKAELENKE
jgi:hypothetical protein